MHGGGGIGRAYARLDVGFHHHVVAIPGHLGNVARLLRRPRRITIALVLTVYALEARVWPVVHTVYGPALVLPASLPRGARRFGWTSAVANWQLPPRLVLRSGVLLILGNC